ncbi:MAG: hypothetical protein M5U14_20140 [Acidimicrobiia bacterium]|nr:hypothetical protein [Acidimicrobiia bacterium]
MSATLLAKLAAVLAVTGGAASAGWVAAAPARPTPDPVATARAWIDDPLDGTVLPPGPVEVVAHATDPDGVVELVLSVDGEELATRPAGGERLARASFVWEPSDDGSYELRVVGRDRSGDEGEPGTAAVLVSADAEVPAGRSATTTPATTAPGETTTTVPETTTTTIAGPSTTRPGPPATSAPPGTAPPVTPPPATTSVTAPPVPTTAPATTTTQPCPGSVTPVVPVGGAVVSGDITFGWSYSGCAPSGFTLRIEEAGIPRVEVSASGSPYVLSAGRLGCRGSFTWQVAPVAGGTTGSWSAEVPFTLVGC